MHQRIILKILTNLIDARERIIQELTSLDSGKYVVYRRCHMRHANVMLIAQTDIVLYQGTLCSS